MTSILHDTALGFLLNVDPPRRQPDLQHKPSWLLRSQNHELSLKLESARISRIQANARREAAGFNNAASMESLSTTSTNSRITKSEEKDQARADKEMGWDGPDDPEV